MHIHILAGTWEQNATLETRMNEFLKMDIFFGVATVATVVVAALVCVAFMYLIRLLSTLDRISKEVEEEAKALRSDLDEARASVKREGLKLSHLFDFFTKSATRILGKKKRKATPATAKKDS